MTSSIEQEGRFAALRQAVKPEVGDALERWVREAADRDLCRVNALHWAAVTRTSEEDAIAGFLRAAQLGIFEISWNVLCPGCAGVLEAGATLKTVDRTAYTCTLCAGDYEPTLDEMVEVTFTVSPRIRRIAAHTPDTLPLPEYMRQVFWGSGADLPDDAALERILDEIVLDAVELPPGEKASVSLQVPAGFIVAFEPVTHAVQFLDVKGDAIRERQALSIVLGKDYSSSGTLELRPGPLRVLFENRAATRTLPALWLAGEQLHTLLGKRRPFLTAKRLLTNQTFRDIYRTDTLNVDQRLKITSLTFLFTDLRGSTELYERVGDLVAYDLVRAHFRVLHEIVAAEAGAVVKTIGDAVMATFPTPDRAVAAALRMREAIRTLDADLLLKIGIHEGPCLAVMLNERQDFFGQTVNVASRVQQLANSRAIFATGQVVTYGAATKVLEASGITPLPREHALRGLSDRWTVYEIP